MDAPKFLRWVWTPYRSRTKQGGALILFALMLPLALGMIGLVLDGARTLYIKNRFDQALRAAVLAAASSKNASNRTSEAQKFFAANFPSSTFKATVTGPTVTLSGSTVRVSASAQCPTYFRNIVLNQDGAKTPNTLNVQGWYEVKLPSVEIVFVVSTGLNNWYSSSVEVKNGLSTLINNVKDSGLGASYFGFVPFANGVAVGDTDLCKKLTGSFKNVPYKSYILEGSTVYTPTSCSLPLKSYAWTTTQPWLASEWVALNNPRPGDTLNRYQAYSNDISFSFQAFEPSLDVHSYNPSQNVYYYGPYSDQGYKRTFSSNPLLLARTSYPYEYAVESFDSNWVPFYVNYYQPQPMVSLRSDTADIISKINNTMGTSNTPNGCNMPNLGMVWALRMLSPQWQGQWVDNLNAEHINLPQDYSSNTKKIIILISPGLTKISSEIISTAGNYSSSYWDNEDKIRELTDHQFQFELYKALVRARQTIQAPIDSLPANQFVQNSPCGSMSQSSCESYLTSRYNNLLSTRSSNYDFSNSIIDLILYNLSKKYDLANYILGNRFYAKGYDYSLSDNGVNQAWDYTYGVFDQDTLIAPYLEFRWKDWYPAFYLTKLCGALYNQQYVSFSGVYRNNIYNMYRLLSYLKIIYGENYTLTNIQSNYSRDYENNISLYLANSYVDGNYPAAYDSRDIFEVGPNYTARFSTNPYNLYLGQSIQLAPLGLGYEGWHGQNTQYIGYSQNIYSYDHSRPDWMRILRQGSFYYYVDWWAEPWGDYYVYETFPNIALQQLNAIGAFVYEVIQAEGSYVSRMNNLTQTLSDYWWTLWRHIPAYGILSTRGRQVTSALPGPFQVNGTTMYSASEATSALNNAFSGVCSALKSNSRNVTIYTLNVGGGDASTMQSCASSVSRYYYADPYSSGQITNALTSITNDILNTSLQSSLVGKSW